MLAPRIINDRTEAACKTPSNRTELALLAMRRQGVQLERPWAHPQRASRFHRRPEQDFADWMFAPSSALPIDSCRHSNDATCF